MTPAVPLPGEVLPGQVWLFTSVDRWSGSLSDLYLTVLAVTPREDPTRRVLCLDLSRQQRQQVYGLPNVWYPWQSNVLWVKEDIFLLELSALATYDTRIIARRCLVVAPGARDEERRTTR